MARISETFDFGSNDDMSQEELILFLQQMYTQLAVAINTKPDIIQRTTNGQTTDTFLANGDININTNTLNVEILTSHPTQTSVTWTTLS